MQFCRYSVDEILGCRLRLLTAGLLEYPRMTLDQFTVRHLDIDCALIELRLDEVLNRPRIERVWIDLKAADLRDVSHRNS